MKYAYFPTAGFISLVASTAGSSGVEVGMIGSEGMLGAHLALDVLPAPLTALVQGAGTTWRIAATALKSQLALSPALRRMTGRYLYVHISQLANSAACLRFHLVGQRLARWLLMSQDRAGTDTFPVTHEFVAYMLGVRRVGITAAATRLRQAGLIEYRRGQLHVTDRPGLKAAACACYEFDRRTRKKVMA